jgi:hypothetical protein
MHVRHIGSPSFLLFSFLALVPASAHCLPYSYLFNFSWIFECVCLPLKLDHGQLEAVAGGACGQQRPYECRGCDYRSWHLWYGMELQKRGLEASVLIVVLRNVHGHRPYQAEQVPQLHYRREE